MYNAPLLGNGRCHGNRIMGDMHRGNMMGCDHPSFISIGALIGEL